MNIATRALAALLAACALAAPALAQPDAAEQRLEDKAIACINDHAAEVERVEPTLTDATDFLVSDLCIDPITIHDRYVANTKLVAGMRTGHNFVYGMFADYGLSSKADKDRLQKQQEDTKASWSNATVDPDTGDIHGTSDTINAGSASMLMQLDRTGDIPTLFRSAAARAVLAARTARLAKQP